MIDPKSIIIALGCILSLAPADAFAQYSPDATLDLGTGFGQMALGQATLSGTRTLGEDNGGATPAGDEKSDTDKAPSLSPKGSLTFERNEEIVKRVTQRFIEEQSADHPELEEQIRVDFESGDLQDYFATLLSRYGYDGNNLADVSAAYYMALWTVVQGREPNARQIDGAQKQVRAYMAQDKSLLELSSARKQEICETFALSAALFLQGYEQLKNSGDRETLANFRRGLQLTYAPNGPDLSAMALTDEGFVIE